MSQRFIRSLKSLRRLQDHVLKQLRTQLTQLENQYHTLDQERQTLQGKKQQEIEAASSSLVARQSLLSYLESIKQRETQIFEEMVLLQSKMDQLNEELTLFYQESKKNEIVQDHYTQLLEEDAKQREQKELDEIGQSRFVYTDSQEDLN